jgi:hypothetical protein
MSDEYPGTLCAKILEEIIPGYLAYRSVLRVVGRAMKKVRSNGLEERLRRGGHIWKAWMVFKGVTEERLAFKDKWDGAMARMPCSNPEVSPLSSVYLLVTLGIDKRLSSQCSNVGDEDSFMRCSGCQEAFYCDKTCQKVDWKVNHREICKTTQAHRKGLYLLRLSKTLSYGLMQWPHLKCLAVTWPSSVL